MIATVEQRIAALRGAPRRSPPARFQLGAPLDDINDHFHSAYEQSRTEARREVPVIVVLADDLILFVRGERRVWSFTPPAFHLIKSLSHAPLGLFTELERLDGAAIAADVRERLRQQRARVLTARARLDDDARMLGSRTRDDLRAMLDACAAFVDQLGERVDRARLDAFAGALGPLLLRLVDDATQLQLSALDGHAREALALLSREEVAALSVVVAGDHQARARSLGVQYFRRLLGEPDGVERRVTYGEGVADEQGALALVGTRRLDQAIGKAFFGDERRLQRDILGDSAAARLKASTLAPHDG